MNLRYNSGLKGRKGQVDEGGMRVPFIVNWKNHIEPGLVSNYPLAHIDLLPTLTSLLGIDYTAKNALDGLDFNSILSDSIEPESRDLYMEWGNNERVLSKDYLMINSGSSIFSISYTIPKIVQGRYQVILRAPLP